MTERTWLTPGTDDGEPSVPAMRDLPRIVLFGAGQIVLFLILFQLYKVVRRTFITRAPWLLFFPGLMIALTAFSLNLVGDAMRDRLDPRFREMFGNRRRR